MHKKVYVLLILLLVVPATIKAEIHQTGVIKIGVILPITGAAASYGQWMQRGIVLAIDDVNGSGGIAGRKFEAIIEDSRSDNRSAVDAANKLIFWDKVSAIETSFTGTTKSIIRITERNRIILFTSATAPAITEGHKYVFRNAASIANEVDRVIKACQDFRFKKVALIYINYDATPWASEYFRKRFESTGGIVTTSQAFQPDSIDFRAQLVKIKNTKPDALFIIGYSQTGLVMKQARELGLKSPFLGISTFELPDVIRIAGSAAEGAIYAKALFDESRPEAAAFVEKYRKLFDETPEFYSATMYDATQIIALVMKKVGFNPDKQRTYILSLKNYPGVSGLTSFLPNGDVEKPVGLKKIQNGVHVFIDR